MKGFFATAAVALAANVSADICATIKAPVDEMSKQPAFTVEYSEADDECIIDCWVHTDKAKMVGLCMNIVDPVTEAMQEAGLYDKTSCQGTSVNAPGTPLSEADPIMMVTSCPEWFLWLGWDSTVKRTMGNQDTKVVLKTKKAVDTVVAMLKKADEPLIA